MTDALVLSPEAAWRLRQERYWREHPHRCHACGRPVEEDERTVHHLTYRWVKGSEPDEVLVGLCDPCHTGRRWMRPSLHVSNNRVSRRHGWMRRGEITNPRRHYRHLFSYSIRWIRWKRFFGWLRYGADLPPWRAPDRRWR